MTRAKPPQDIVNRRAEGKGKQSQESDTPRFRDTISKSWKIAAGGITLLATALGIATGYLSLLPKLTASQNQPLDLNDPFSTPFVVSNDGPLGINDVKFSCGLGEVVTAHGTMSEFSVADAKSNVDGMETGERTTVPCVFNTIFSKDWGPIISGDITLAASFRPDFVYWHIDRNFRFKTLKGSDGNLYWYPYAYERTPEAKAEREKAATH